MRDQREKERQRRENEKSSSQKETENSMRKCHQQAQQQLQTLTSKAIKQNTPNTNGGGHKGIFSSRNLQ